MKNIKQKFGLAAIVLALPLNIASADPVVFNVNMSVQSALGNFQPANGDGVRVLGLNGDWTIGVAMAPSAADPSIYTVTNSLAADSWPNYKFVITPTNSLWIWESPATFGGGNRYFEVPPGGTNLPTVYFSDDTNLPSYTVQITFQADMQVAILNANFTPGSDYVEAFGSWNNWGDTGVLLANVPGTSNYVGVLTTTALATNTVVSYKFAIDGSGGTWEGNVGTNGASSRSFVLTSTNEVLPLVYWNNDTNVNFNFLVGFTVNMSIEDALGVFTPGQDVVFVNGSWSTFSGSDFLLTEEGSSDVYTGAVAMALAPGTTVNYKYAIDGTGGIWENNGVGPGGALDRQFLLNTATNLPMDYFNNYLDLGPVTLSGPEGQTVISWASGTNANNRIQLQSATSLPGSWSNVPNTQGYSSVTNNFGPGPMFFRLTGP